MRYVWNHFPNRLQTWKLFSDYLVDDTIDFGPSAKTKMAAIKLFNMYAIDTPWSMMSYHLKDGRCWFWAICLNQDGCYWTFKIYAEMFLGARPASLMH